MQDMRTTTGQRVSISYDPSTNALIFREEDWFADPLRSTGVPVKSQIVRRPAAPPRAGSPRWLQGKWHGGSASRQ